MTWDYSSGFTVYEADGSTVVGTVTPERAVLECRRMGGMVGGTLELAAELGDFQGLQPGRRIKVRVNGGQWGDYVITRLRSGQSQARLRVELCSWLHWQLQGLRPVMTLGAVAGTGTTVGTALAYLLEDWAGLAVNLSVAEVPLVRLSLNGGNDLGAVCDTLARMAGCAWGDP